MHPNQKIAINRWKRHFNQVTAVAQINSQKLPHLKARLLGYLMGDGSVFARYDNVGKLHHTCVFYPDDELMLFSYLEAFSSLYGFYPHVTLLKNHYSVRADSKPVVMDLMKYGSFRSLEWKIPFFENQEELKEWLRAFFDCEAHVTSKSITIQSVNKSGLLQVKEALESFLIYSHFYEYTRKNRNWNINYILVISGKEHINNFFKRIGFSHNKKRRAAIA